MSEFVKGGVMMRGMDLIRHILLVTEAADGHLEGADFLDGRWDYQTVGYHVDLMAAHGLLDARASKAYGADYSNIVVAGLTWGGCDYLDAIRDEQV